MYKISKSQTLTSFNLRKMYETIMTDYDKLTHFYDEATGRPYFAFDVTATD